MFKDKTILYIVHNYNSFQKDPIEEIAKNFKKVYVLVRYKPISKIAKYLPFKWLKKYDDKYIIDLSNKPKNVEVIKTSVWYLPFGIFYKWLGELHFRAVDRVIKKRDIKFDLVHCHFLWSSGYVGMRLKQKYKKPFIVTGHGFDVYQLPSQSASWRKRIIRILHSADKAITVSEKNKEILLNLNIEKGKTEILSNSYNSDIFFLRDKGECREELGIDLNREIVLSVGNLEEVKGHKYLIEAMNILINKQKYRQIILYVIGGGRLKGSFENQILKYNLEDYIVLLGTQLHREIPIWMNACDLFVMPSLSEGLPISMLEALGCGKPFVGTYVGGIPEVINSEDYGILVPPKKSKDLAKALEKALKKQWDKDKITKYSKSFTQETINEKIVNLYKEMLYEKDL